LAVWADRDSSDQPSACIDGDVEVEVSRRSGERAEIMCTNGWSGWVDGRFLHGFSFSANGLRQVGGGLGVRMLGRFERDGNDTLIRSGSLTFNAYTPCTLDFTGKRTGA
jgi:hypothetical protein